MKIIKDKKNKGLTGKQEFKKRWQEYTEELYKKDLHDQDNNNGVTTHLEPHPGMQSQVGLRKHHYKKLVEVMEFQVSYFKSQKMMLLVLPSIFQQI